MGDGPSWCLLFVVRSGKCTLFASGIDVELSVDVTCLNGTERYIIIRYICGEGSSICSIEYYTIISTLLTLLD